ncbi:unannotated protein [freshwater metagenome]|uniref:Unannotated protein n=1 Tax=freshwater metagenome TaxID=449393 RepID=A0A6J6Q9Q0_9ZZZZ
MVEVMNAPKETMKASSAIIIRARVAGISPAYVAKIAGLNAWLSVIPRMLARTKNVWARASTDQMSAAIEARTASDRPTLEITPSLPDGSSRQAASSQPIVARAAISVSRRSVGTPQATSGPGSESPAAGDSYPPPVTTKETASAQTASTTRATASKEIAPKPSGGAVVLCGARSVAVCLIDVCALPE